MCISDIVNMATWIPCHSETRGNMVDGSKEFWLVELCSQNCMSNTDDIVEDVYLNLDGET